MIGKYKCMYVSVQELYVNNVVLAMLFTELNVEQWHNFKHRNSKRFLIRICKTTFTINFNHEPVVPISDRKVNIEIT